jgi:hypothetical protein
MLFQRGNMNTSLYKITNELVERLDAIALADGEITDELEMQINNTSKSLSEKTDSIVSWVQYQNDLIDLAKRRVEELNLFIQGTKKKLDGLDKYVDNCMAKMGTAKLEGELNCIKKRKPVLVVDIYDETMIPMDFVKIPPPPPATISKTDVAKALKSGAEVPGARLVESKNISLSYGLK